MDYSEYIADYYGLSESEMMKLFGSDSETQAQMLQEQPDLRRAVAEMESFICTNIRDFSR